VEGENHKWTLRLRCWAQYVTHFPKEEKYVSLLRQADEPEAQASLDAQRARLRGLARARAADAALVAEPNEGRSLALAGQAADQASERHRAFLARLSADVVNALAMKSVGRACQCGHGTALGLE